MQSAAAFLAAPLLLVALAGCLSGTDSVEPPPQPPTMGAAHATDDALHVTVPIGVVLLGFPAATATALAAELDNETVEHHSLSFPRNFILDDAASYRTEPTGIVPTARYVLHDLGTAAAARYFAALEATRTDDAGYDAAAAEAELASLFADAGFTPDPNRPALVVVHGNPGTHPGYRLQMHNGWIEGVRTFGERGPFLVVDTSAPVDRFAGDSRDYNTPIEAGDVDALMDLVVDATHFRLLQGPIYPVATEPCHAVTLIVATRATSITELHPDFGKASDAVDAASLQSAWVNLTGDEVFVDPVFLLLPVDDPPLDAISRLAAKGTADGLAAVRYWLDENWDNYWVPHEGCYPYVSFLLYGDWADAGLFGIAMYQTDGGHRVSFSLVGEDVRWIDEQGPGTGVVFGSRPVSRENPDWVDFLFAHETGHLLGQRHPHDITHADGGDFTFSFSSVWTSMSYQHADRLVDFGAIDHANHARNQVGAAYLAAREAGITDAELEPVLAALAEADWKTAAALLQDGTSPT